MRGLFIVLGFTSTKRDSRAIIGRYKSSEELRDIYTTNIVKRGAIKSNYIFIFKQVESGSIAWFLVSFDIKNVTSKKSGKLRKPTKEYSKIKKHMLSKLCAYVDMSTYICPENIKIEPLLTELNISNYKIEYYPITPLGEKTKKYLKETFEKTIEYLRSQLITLISRIERSDKRANKLRKLAENSITQFKEIIDIALRNKSKFETIELDLTPLITLVKSQSEKLEKTINLKWGAKL